jgi:hypothetical protein
LIFHARFAATANSFWTNGGQPRKSKDVKIKCMPFICLISLLACGCASNEQYVYFPDQKKIVEDPGKGRIYVIAPRLDGMKISPQINDDGESIGNTSARGFLCWERKPGQTIISAQTDNTSEVTVDVQAGKVIYIIQTANMRWTGTDNRLDVVSEQEGREALKSCRPPVCYVTNTNGAAGR